MQLIARYLRQMNQAYRRLHKIRQHSGLAVDQLAHGRHLFPRSFPMMQRHHQGKGKCRGFPFPCFGKALPVWHNLFLEGQNLFACHNSYWMSNNCSTVHMMFAGRRPSIFHPPRCAQFGSRLVHRFTDPGQVRVMNGSTLAASRITNTRVRRRVIH